jgi:SAM-dependent methyltransferase
LTHLIWQENGHPCEDEWRSERGAPVPKRVVLADDTLSADSAYRLACAGTGMLWRGDFQNARLLLQALARRCDAPKKVRRASKTNPEVTHSPQENFHLHRQAQSQRARTLSMILIQVNPDRQISLRRAPDWRDAMKEAWGPAGTTGCVTSLRELLGLVGSHEWHQKGMEISALGSAPNNRIHPSYGVFSPVRGEYIQLVADAPLPSSELAFDIGVGTGVLSAVLAKRGVKRVIGTDLDPRALACAKENIQRLGLQSKVELKSADLFPEGKAPFIVCNPPWLPARASAPIERAIYDENSTMLKGFLAGLAAHLSPKGEGWLILSDLAEHLGLRTRAELEEWMAAGGLKVLGKIDTKAEHKKVQDESDPLHAARTAEVTSLWRLAVI